MKTAVCDSDAFYPLRDLVLGPLNTLDDLPAIERFIRTVVLHDEMVMELTPWAYDEEGDAERKRQGERMVITAIGPVLSGFEFIQENGRLPDATGITLSDSQIAIASRFANAGPGNLWYDSHIEFLQRVLGHVKIGAGSALLVSDFGNEAIKAAEKYPVSLFNEMDKDWQQFAQNAQHHRLGLRVPPVLGIVLSRCASRDAIPIVIKDLRDEWTYARKKVWSLIDELKNCRDIGDARTIERQFAEASQLFAPKKNEDIDSAPVRILWEILAAGAAGGFLAQASGTPKGIGVLAGALGRGTGLVGHVHDFGAKLFGLGAFDLANKIRRETAKVEIDALPKLLTKAERASLNLD